MIVSPELQEIDQRAGHLCRGYAIEGEVALVIRTTGDAIAPVRVIGQAHDRNKLAHLLRLAAQALDA